MTKATAEKVLRLGQMIESGKVTDEMLADLMDGVANPILTLIHEGVEIGATTGYETIARSPDVFAGFLSVEFERLGTDKRGVATAPALVDVHEMDPDKRPNATFAEMFASLGNPHNLVLTQGQIINFCTCRPDLLRRDGCATFFPFRVKEELFVAYVYVGGGAIETYLHRFDYGYRWGAVSRHRVVAPQR